MVRHNRRSFVMHNQSRRSGPAAQTGKYPKFSKAGERIINRQLLGKSGLPPFRYWDKGSMAVVGEGFAVLKTGKIQLKGFLAWLALDRRQRAARFPADPEFSPSTASHRKRPLVPRAVRTRPNRSRRELT
jgi:hypothetical protein